MIANRQDAKAARKGDFPDSRTLALLASWRLIVFLR